MKPATQPQTLNNSISMDISTTLKNNQGTSTFREPKQNSYKEAANMQRSIISSRVLQTRDRKVKYTSIGKSQSSANLLSVKVNSYAPSPRSTTPRSSAYPICQSLYVDSSKGKINGKSYSIGNQNSHLTLQQQRKNMQQREMTKT